MQKCFKSWKCLASKPKNYALWSFLQFYIEIYDTFLHLHYLITKINLHLLILLHFLCSFFLWFLGFEYSSFSCPEMDYSAIYLLCSSGRGCPPFLSNKPKQTLAHLSDVEIIRWDRGTKASPKTHLSGMQQPVSKWKRWASPILKRINYS